MDAIVKFAVVTLSWILVILTVEYIVLQGELNGVHVYSINNT